MATSIYITNDVKTTLDRVCELDKRSIVDEIDYLVSNRLAAIEASQASPQQTNGGQADSNIVHEKEEA